jgi:hypothetical protein
MAASYSLPTDICSSELSYDKEYSATVLNDAVHRRRASKTWIVFARSNAGIVGSNPTQDMYVCL